LFRGRCGSGCSSLSPVPPVVARVNSTPAPMASGLANRASAPMSPHVHAQRDAPTWRGHAMLDLHYWPTPNGKKVTILLEECGLEYKVVPVNIGRGDQFTPEFLKMNPN